MFLLKPIGVNESLIVIYPGIDICFTFDSCIKFIQVSSENYLTQEGGKSISTSFCFSSANDLTPNLSSSEICV